MPLTARRWVGKMGEVGGEDGGGGWGGFKEDG